jgi:hypothetical protein
MEMQQMLAHLLAEIRFSEEKMDGNQAKMDANQVKTDTSMKTYMQETKASMQEVTAKIEDSLREEIKHGQVEMRSTVSVLGDKMSALITGMKDGQKETMA